VASLGFDAGREGGTGATGCTELGRQPSDFVEVKVNRHWWALWEGGCVI